MTLRMPAEWERQEATWLAWPHHEPDWPGRFEPIPWAYGEIIRTITHTQRVRLIVKDAAHKKAAHKLLKRVHTDLKKVDFIMLHTDRSWMRDPGITFVYDGKERVLLNWRFNGWGGKYNNWHRDEQIPKAIEKFLKVRRIEPTAIINGKKTRITLEGGSIDVNGKGSLLTSEECLLSDIQSRNPGLTRAGYEKVFAEYLGVSNTIWLGKGITGDDTHGHIDDLARFANPTTIVTVIEAQKKDPNYRPLQDNLKRLKKARDQNGKPFTIVELPMPHLHFEGMRLPASYANFLIANGLILVPTFNDINDRIALNILSEVFPRHEVIGIYCGDFIWGFGTLHCSSQQEPQERT